MAGVRLGHRPARERAGQPDGGALEPAPPLTPTGDRAALKKTLTAAVAAHTLSAATLAPTSQAQAGSLGKAVAIGILGTAIGAIAVGSVRARQEQDDRFYGHYDERPDYRSSGFRPVRGGHESTYGGCGFRNSPIFDEDGNRIGSRRVPAC
ncbi:hypothetical protein [Methylobacterium sp. Leaf118]|uniref:hypothetical protein n=1 Tax=Methylobacterium sp. Leaf118 TaxID=2876562 RepID=UPI001E56F363|nr:hypothetical protein [Methylobacterium sp. Leaf118]